MFELYQGDCLELMATLPDKSIDCVLTDPPYGTTACKWDSVIPFEPMWKELKRIAKPKAAICLFGSQPFTSALVMSNPQMFRYEWIWNKVNISGFLDANRRPLRKHENIVVFSSDATAYFPCCSGTATQSFGKKQQGSRKVGVYTGEFGEVQKQGVGYPQSIIQFQRPNNLTGDGGYHPTQKPVELLRYLIRTYTQTGETVLDFTMGSGSTGVACELEQRNFIGIEKDADYFEIAKQRIEGVKTKEPLFAAA